MMKNKALNSFNYFEKIEMRWSDIDALGHVNNAIIVTYFETARAKFIQKWGISKMIFILASINVDYLKQVNYPNKITIGQNIKKIGKKSLTIEAGLFLKDSTLAAISNVVLVAFDYEKQKSIPIPKKIKDFYLKLKSQT